MMKKYLLETSSLRTSFTNPQILIFLIINSYLNCWLPYFYFRGFFTFDFRIFWWDKWV